MKVAYQQVGRKKTTKAIASASGNVTGVDLQPLVSALRSQALDIQFSGTQGELRGSVFGVMLESAYDDRVASLVALADGSVSFYVSTGHGCIGCDNDLEVRRAAQALVVNAESLQSFCSPAVDRAAPTCGQVRLFLMTQSGLMSIEEDIDAVNRPVSAGDAQLAPLAAIYADAQRLLQLIDRRGAGVSLEQEVVAMLADQADAESQSTESRSSGNSTCSSVGNVARRLRT
jgi:hypothetical protein